MISAKIIADSICNGHRITTKKVTFPRIILAELNTHRMLSKNSASSRAIPFKKMLRAVLDNPFIPIAWQKDHAGMQGTEYYLPDEKFEFLSVAEYLVNRFKLEDSDEDFETVKGVLTRILYRQEFIGQKTLTEWWLTIRDLVVDCATLMFCFGVTKQICNRLLEPFTWVTVLVTATEWENFFHLRCPQYVIYDGDSCGKKKIVYRSKKDYLQSIEQFPGIHAKCMERTDLDWLKQNEGQAEIHMMATAEAMWDAYTGSTPKELKPGEWHMPYGDSLATDTDNIGRLSRLDYDADDVRENMLQICTARCAQTSYTVMGEDGKPSSYEVLLDVFGSLAIRPYTNRKGKVFGVDDPVHMSPLEHCAQAMTDIQYMRYGHAIPHENPIQTTTAQIEYGWCKNFRGWIQYRSMFPNENRR